MTCEPVRLLVRLTVQTTSVYCVQGGAGGEHHEWRAFHGCRSRDVDEPAKPGPSPLGHTLWKWSLVAYGTANALDVASSVGPHYGHETNSLLTNSTGTFDVGRAIAVKGSAFAATGIAEYLIIRKWPQLTKLFSVVNFGWTAGEAGVAAHNFTLRK